MTDRTKTNRQYPPRPDVGSLAPLTPIVPDSTLDDGFVLDQQGLRLAETGKHRAFHRRHGLELAFLQPIFGPVLAGLAAARTALLCGKLEVACGLLPALPALGWIAHLDGDAPPDEKGADIAWSFLATHQPGVTAKPNAGALQALATIWQLLGPAEWLMESGGDVRLQVDPITGLNGYGASHRPRPWAITFASSTASSVSERGYQAAERARQDLLRHALQSNAVAAAAGQLRQQLGALFGLPADGGVVLAASGTDCELFCLAIAAAHPHEGGAPLTNILIAPEETGTGVPLAAVGKNFAVDTAYGDAVEKNALVEGFRSDTVLESVRLRQVHGALRPLPEVAAQCRAVIAAAPGRCVLHMLDVSKTGLLGPAEQDLLALQAAYPDKIDIVVDACQVRLAPWRVARYLRAGWMVQVTGSKFFTGPPFAGAVLLPPALMQRLAQARALPAGLQAYSSRAEWPACNATAALPDRANPGLLLRWQAALAEIEAFLRVPPVQIRGFLRGFTDHVRASIRANPDLRLIEPVPLDRAAGPDDWDGIPTIISFALIDPQTSTELDPAAARQIYQWLNADLRDAMPGLSDADQLDAGRHCHIGQPAVLPAKDGGTIGALRISAGARLVSGEERMSPLPPDEKLDQEIADAQLVLRKISLLLRHREILQRSNPPPSYL